jgi:hypothetical protein
MRAKRRSAPARLQATALGLHDKVTIDEPVLPHLSKNTKSVIEDANEDQSKMIIAGQLR